MSPIERLARLRARMGGAGVTGMLVPRADEHLAEYVPAASQRLEWLTGFTGSAGLAAVLPDRAAFLTDGRYITQALAEVDPALFELRHVENEPVTAWLARYAPGAPIGYDPRLMSEEAVAAYVRAGLRMVPLDANPLDAAWSDRPAPPAEPVRAHELRYAGVPGAEKRQQLADLLRRDGQRAAVLTDPASVAWLLNIRGADVEYTPFVLAFAIAYDDATVDVFLDPARLPSDARENAVRARPPAELAGALDALNGQRVRIDATNTPAWFAQRLRAAGAEVVAGDDPAALPRARKNATEQDGARAAHRRDAIALCGFLHWLDTAPPGRETEMSAAARLVEFRQQQALFMGESFPAISGSGPNGAIIHYRASEATNRVIGPNEPYLIDSGAQYLDGTTDVTRTVWIGPGRPSDELRTRVTLVLAGHITLAGTVFPQGTTGLHLDAFARRALWQHGLDYDHGTGHGIGSYLSVHEGPARIARRGSMVPIEPGMILSNEPGFYLPGAYGIRLENLLLVQATELSTTRPFLRFETLTLAPFDCRLIDRRLLNEEQITFLDAYHTRVLAEIGPSLPGETLKWLEIHTST